MGQGRIFLLNWKLVIVDVPGWHLDKLLKSQSALPGESCLQPGGTHALLTLAPQATPEGSQGEAAICARGSPVCHRLLQPELRSLLGQ